MSDSTKLKIVGMICGTVLFLAVFIIPTRNPCLKGNSGERPYMRSLAGDLWHEFWDWVNPDEGR